MYNIILRSGITKRVCHKILLAMRLTAVILLATLMHVSAATLGQRITLNTKNKPLSSVLKEIRKQSGFDFYFDEKTVPATQYVDISVKNATLQETLETAFKGLKLRYDIDGKLVTISKAESRTILDKVADIFASIDVTGKVISSDGSALPGATVKVKGTTRTTTTNADGEFSLKEVDEREVIVISFIGYETRELRVTANMSNIVLQSNTSGLNEIQIIGYGTTTQKLNTGSVKSIKADEIGRQPVNNPLLALQGNVAGVYVAQSSGLPGAGISVNIRGRNSIGAGNEPLYIVDGIPFNSRPIEQQSGGGYSLGANGDTSPFTSINPADIESMSILKDADATAIYGSRGANGVILITTKKGKAGKTDVNINLYSGFGNPASKMDLLNSEQYLALRQQAFSNDGVTPSAFNAPDLLNWGNENRDFQKILIGNTGHVTEATASVSGGQKNTTFFASGTYRNEGSVFPGSKGYQRGSGLLNASHSSENKRFNVAVSVSISKDKNTLTPVDITSDALMLPPNYPLYNSDGTFFWDNNFQNPLAIVNNPYQTKANNTRATLSLGYEIITGLRIKTDLAYNRQQSDQQLSYLQSNGGPSGNATMSYLSSNVAEGLTIEPQANYNKTFGRSKLQVVIGGTYQSSDATTPYFVGISGIPLDKLIYNLASAENIMNISNSVSQYRYVSVFGRANYQIDDKYILNISGRRDGSSRFGPNKKFGNFGAVGAAWIFSSEEFAQKSLSWLSFGKLRASYGAVGNDQIPDYGYLATYRNNNFKYGNAVAYYPVRYPNDDYSWESTDKMELALELGFLKNRILFTAAGFIHRTRSMLVDSPLSYQTGFESYQANLPAVVQNTGLELELNTTNIEQKDFSWKSSINVTIPRNKLISFPDLERSSYANEYIVGQPLSVINLYRVKKIVNGLVEIEDVDGDGTISPGISANGRGDYVNVGYSSPKMYGGFTNTFQFKNLQLDVFLQFARQAGFSNQYLSETPPGFMNNMSTSLLNSGLRPTADYGDAFYSYLDYTQSERVLSDASFIRAKNISLSYKLPAKWTEKLKISNCNIYMRGQNLFTITNYEGLDPETQTLSVPPLKMFTLGIQCSL